MNKKILLSLGALLAMVAGVAGFSAWEAHVINVTAHIENALAIHGEPLHFGTVFPQEYLTKNFTVKLSPSFLDSGRLDEVSYKIVQKPKCECDFDLSDDRCTEGQYASIHYASHLCPVNYTEMKDLCAFLSKLPAFDPSDGEIGVPSYYIEGTTDSCYARGDNDTRDHIATGVLGDADIADEWIVDLKVPPVDGYIGQDWPSSCAAWAVPIDGADYGCDLWLEVTNIDLPLI